MAKLKEIRIRIASIKNTRQVTSAMKMVSAAKLKKAQDYIMQIAPFDKKLHEIVQNLSLEEFDADSVYFSQPEIKSNAKIDKAKIDTGKILFFIICNFKLIIYLIHTIYSFFKYESIVHHNYM